MITGEALVAMLALNGVELSQHNIDCIKPYMWHLHTPGPRPKAPGGMFVVFDDGWADHPDHPQDEKFWDDMWFVTEPNFRNDNGAIIAWRPV